MSAPETGGRMHGFTAWLNARFASAAAIYGLIVFSAFLAISSDHAEDAWDMLDTSAWSLVVFFLAHVFAHTLTDHGARGLGPATWHSIQHSAGMLYAAIPSTIVLIIGGIQGAPADDVYEATTWVTLVVLAILGYVAYWRRGAHLVVRLLGALGTAVLGLIIVALEYSIH
ncbi:hypothetical protein ACTU3I_16015 [Microbacterium sp. RD1]|uniref:hypothetical protein n=1 Tax=Microbacterium sp. RD1 TaxID=3457313 RepID=UPI003FA57107